MPIRLIFKRFERVEMGRLAWGAAHLPLTLAMVAAFLPATPTRVSAQNPFFNAPALVSFAGNDHSGLSPNGDANCIAAGDLNNDDRADLVVARLNDDTTTPRLNILLATNSAVSQGYFSSTNYRIPLADQPQWVRFADVTGDGKLDLVVLFTHLFAIAVLKGGGDASFGDPLNYGLLSQGNRFEVTDLDADGDLDLAVTTGGNQLEVLRNAGNGAFGSSTPYAAGGVSLAIGDVTGDGIRDVVTGGPGAGFSVLRGMGGGAFAAPVFWPAAGTLTDLVLADLNGDNSLDVVATLGAANLISAHPNSGIGGFPAGSSYTVPAVEQEPYSIAAGNMDADPGLEFVVGYRNDYAPTRSIGVFQTNLLELPAFYDGGTFPKDVIDDVNADGLPDVVTASSSTGTSVSYMNTVQLLLNQGGALGGGIHVDLVSAPTGACPVDLNRDGKQDLVISSDTGTRIYMGTGDGLYSFFNFSILAGSRRHPVAGDVNRDGNPDVVLRNNTGSLLLYIGNGDGTFSAATTLYAAGDSLFRQSLSTDLNRDGFLDLVLHRGANIAIALATGDGIFVPTPTVYNVGFGQVQDIAIADIDHNGWPDISAATTFGLGFLMGTGGGLFNPVTAVNGPELKSITANDFDRDGLLDLATRVQFPGSIRMYWGDPFGFFSPAGVITGVGEYPEFLDSWDVDRDGFPDIVTSSYYYGSAGPASAIVLRGGVGPNRFSWFGPPSGYLVGGTRGLLLPNQLFTTRLDAVLDAQPDILGFTFDSDPPNTFHSMSILPAVHRDWPANYAAKVDFAMPSQPIALAIGDLDFNGKLDFVASSYPTGTTAVCFGDGLGGFAVGQQFTGTALATDLLMLDFNRDGLQDLITAGGQKIEIYAMGPEGTFGPKTTFPLALSSAEEHLAPGDVNRDGVMDILHTGYGAQAHLLHSNFDGTFSVSPVPSSTDLRYARLIDMNRDGRLDIVASTGTGNSVRVVHGVGDGTFMAPVETPVGAETGAIAVADFNRDGIPDVAVTFFGPLGDSVSVMLGNGAAGFTPAVRYTLMGQASDLHATDMTGDGIPDLVALNMSNQGRVWIGVGNGTFTGPNTFGTGFQPYRMAIGDFNRDSKPDALTTNVNSSTASVILNASITTGTPVVEPVPPAAARLMQNAPNPFNPKTTIRFALPRPGRARLVVYDAAGRRVVTLLDRSLPAGEASVVWDGRDRAGRPSVSGIYFYKLEAEGVELSRKMALLK